MELLAYNIFNSRFLQQINFLFIYNFVIHFVRIHTFNYVVTLSDPHFQLFYFDWLVV